MTFTEDLNRFVILLYKCLLLRKRHYIITIIEIVLPILIASIPAIIMSQFGSVSMSSRHENATIYPPSDPYDTSIVSTYRDVWLLYSPNTTTVTNFHQHAAQLWLNKSSRSEGYRTEVLGFKTSQELEATGLALVPNGTVIGTIFHSDLDKRQLSYTIKYGSQDYYNFFTNAKMQYRLGPHYKTYYVETYFLSWQAAVEQSFIHQQTGRRDFQVQLQRFPYPAYDTETPLSVFIEVIVSCFIYCYIIPLYILLKRVVEEKANKSKELLKIMGMNNCNYWSSTFANYFIMGALTMLIISIIYTAPLPNSIKVLAKTDTFLLFIVFLLYITAIILNCFVVTVLFNKANVAVAFGMVILIVPSSVLSGFYLSGDSFQGAFADLDSWKKHAICLLPGGAIQVALRFMGILSMSGEGVYWSTLHSNVAMPDMTLGSTMLMMFVSCIVYGVLTWYLDAVWPWQFGVPKPFYFLFTKSYWCGNKKEYRDEQEMITIQSDVFEPDPINSTPGIVIRNLSKIFKSGMQPKAAVDGVSLNIYSGQITALLGRNGAGKTTTVSMLTGLFTPSSGSATISGYDIESQMDEARKSIGICPQENIMYPTLTAKEHLELIAGLKGVPWSEIKTEVQRVLQLLNLGNKENALSQSLSGGMKRKLSLGMALVGDSKVLFLDEPTSGMDVENRRGLWDILLSIRHDRTIVLTTHYMEEADILGDRIAIMVDGKIRCCGSPIFLKRKFGTGYRLNIVRQKNCDIAGLTNELKNSIIKTELEETGEKELKYSFPENVSGRVYAEMFQRLEQSKDKLGIESFGMTVTTMDDVFLRVNTIEEQNLLKPELMERNDMDAFTAEDDSIFLMERTNLETGFKLWVNRILAIFMKRFSYAKRYKTVVVYQVLLPIIMLCIFFIIMRVITSSSNRSPPSLNLNLKAIYGSTESVFQPDDSLKKFSDDGFTPVLRDNGATVTEEKDAQQYILDVGTHSLNRYLKRLLVGGSANKLQDTSLNLTTLYNGEPFHTLPIALNLMHTSLLRFLSGDTSARISVTNAPFPVLDTFSSMFDPMMLKGPMLIMGSVFVPLILGYVAGAYISVPIHEYNTRAKLLQMMTGMSAFTYWFGMFTWDMLTHSVVSLILLIPFAGFAASTFFPYADAIGSVLLLLIMFGWSIIPFCYMFSPLLKKPASGYNLIMSINMLFGLIPSMVLSLITGFVGSTNTKIIVTRYFFRLIPIYAVTSGLSNVITTSYINVRCSWVPADTLKYMCMQSSISESIIQCCKDKCGTRCVTRTATMTWDENGCGRDLVFLFIDGFLYFGILLFLETGIFRRCSQMIYASLCRSRLHTRGVVLSATTTTDSDVDREIQRIENTNMQADLDEALVSVGLTKHYWSLCAVNNLTFAVHKQECFGLLGVNGAGKTSTFMMLTGDILPTSGNAYIQKHNLQTELKKFQSFIGYCPQFDALIDLLTGREMLRLFAIIRGVPLHSINKCVSKILQGTDLEEFADKQTKDYSGGNKRKLSLALALIGNPPLVLLDEPTAGVDPMSRRKIWNILKQAREVTRTAVVLCTHSMEECEALCSRLAIMVKGQFRCIGSIQHLKTKFGQGFSVVIKFKNKGILEESVIENVKTTIMMRFPSAVMKEYQQGVMNFHVTDPSIPWSSLFGSMEHIKEQFDLEDYFISGTSLEQIFLAFARN